MISDPRFWSLTDKDRISILAFGDKSETLNHLKIVNLTIQIIITIMLKFLYSDRLNNKLANISTCIYFQPFTITLTVY